MGNLTKDKFGFTAPVWSPMMTDAPLIINDSENLLFFYEADFDSVNDILPEGVEPLSEPPVIQAIFNHSFGGSAGPHFGNYIFPLVKYNGKPYTYEHFLMVTNDVAMIMGREYWGDAKKLCHTEWVWEGNELMIKVERPKGLTLLSAHFRIEKPSSPEILNSNHYPCLALKYIPSCEGKGKPDVHKYIEGNLEIIPSTNGNVELWIGTGSVWMPSPTDVCPIYKLNPKKIIAAYYLRCGFKMDFAKVIKDFNQS